MNLLKGSTDGIDLAKLAEKMNLRDVCICFRNNIEPGYQNYIIHLIKPAHWVGLVIHNNTAYYFDSLHLDVPEDIISQISANKVVYNDREVQPMNEAYCGEYVLYFLNHMRHPSVDNYRRMLMNLK